MLDVLLADESPFWIVWSIVQTILLLPFLPLLVLACGLQGACL